MRSACRRPTCGSSPRTWAAASARRCSSFRRTSCWCGPYRGVSRPVLTFTLERLMDTAARRFGIDPVEIRRRNLIRKFPYTSASGLVYDEGSYLQTLEAAAQAIDLPAFRREQARLREHGRYWGLGFSSFSERSGYGSRAFAPRKSDIAAGYLPGEDGVDPF